MQLLKRLEKLFPPPWKTAIYRLRMRIQRVRRAIAYVRDRLTAADAETLMLDCRNAAGWYPLLILSTDDTLEEAHNTFVYHPNLERLVSDACATVEHKWNCAGDELWNARRWALDLVEHYADQDKTPLTRLDQIEDIFPLPCDEPDIEQIHAHSS